jgi:transportin-1
MQPGWTPVAAGVEQIVAVLQNAENSDREVQQQVLIAFENFQNIPDYNSYLAYIYVQLADQLTVDVRFGAGLALKNNITLVGSNQYVKEEVAKVIADPNVRMRRSCGMLSSF